MRERADERETEEKEKEKMGKKVEEERISYSPVRAHPDAREERKRGKCVEAEKKRRRMKEGERLIKRDR